MAEIKDEVLILEDIHEEKKPPKSKVKFVRKAAWN